MSYLCPTYTKYFRLASLVYTSILLHGLNTNASLLSLKEAGNTVNFHANEVFIFIFVAMRECYNICGERFINLNYFTLGIICRNKLEEKKNQFDIYLNFVILKVKSNLK